MLDDWNDLRLVLAVARERGLVGAARVLGIDHSTAFRRLHGIERRLGTPLFERLPGGSYAPTAVGERMAAAAERMEDEALALDRDITGRDRRLVGRLRVTSSETLAHRILMPHLAAFRRTHPGVVVELAVDNRVLALSRREADVALRPMRPTEGDLWGRKIADIAWAIYGSRTYFAANASLSTPADITSHPLVGWDENTTDIKAAEWLSAIAPASAVVYRTTSLINQLNAAKEGLGLAVLPCYLGDLEPDLDRAVRGTVPELARELWIITHSDLRGTARVRAFFDVVGNGLTKKRDLFGGRRPAHRPRASRAVASRRR